MERQMTVMTDRPRFGSVCLLLAVCASGCASSDREPAANVLVIVPLEGAPDDLESAQGVVTLFLTAQRPTAEFRSNGVTRTLKLEHVGASGRVQVIIDEESLIAAPGDLLPGREILVVSSDPFTQSCVLKSQWTTAAPFLIPESGT